ncbi:MAG: hypothetical protein A3G34_17065 [Candidatus Lindowbacteria bacterium RIFCSPLOWO2_12_FULL_62_27]|nr:MAG: hypothetical protein A3G34_17065 [Candidatus Lindowbacteria bacterium RIFCSPLOWO2_12_FULL_62_27]OGH63966.1 MAG: hypothetical protein A3I06_10420 [Candidatus Lindowbacteria bacterium RIFCSPLOWO2_02_FULL_62_12]
MDPDRVRREQDHFDKVAEAEGYSWWGAGTPAGKLRTERRSALVRDALGPDPRKLVLEIGCGSGEMTPHLAGHFRLVVGIDVSLGLLKRFRQRLGGQAAGVLADGERLPFRPGTFDAVCGNNILHHLELDRILPVCARQLKSGGRLAFAEPNLLNPQNWIENRITFVRRLRPYSPDEMPFTRWHIVRKLKEHGFRDARARPFDFLHPSTPDRLIPAVSAFGRFLERMPLTGEIAGSMIISAVKI